MKHILLGLFIVSIYLLQAQPSGKKVPVSPIPVHKDSLKNDPVVKDSTKIKDNPAPHKPQINLPVAFSLRKYCPDAGYIGRLGSDVGFALGYGAMTVEMAIAHNLSDIETITRKAYSPYFALSIESAATHYVNLIEAINLLKEKGNYPLLELYNPEKASSSQAVHISQVDTLFKLNQKAMPSDSMMHHIKTALNAKHPVIIRIKTDSGLGKFNDKAAIFKPMVPAKDFTGTTFLLTGYKDGENGGMVEIMGHRGAEWADKGFFYMSYADLLNQLMEAYTIGLK